MNVADFDYDLPEDLIAQTPIEPRDHSKLMIVDPISKSITHHQFYDIVDYINPSDVLVVNQSRVIPARLHGARKDTQSKVELLLLRPLTDTNWEVLVKPGKRCKIGAKLVFGDKLEATVISNTKVGGRIIEFHFEGNFDSILEALGETPLPPYITAQLLDQERYQTVYAKEKGSVAAPTAGLHFTSELIDKIRAKGVTIVPVTLHVGLGTFRPVKVDIVEEHQMHEEYYSLSPDNAKILNQCHAQGGRVIAVGTTVVRVLETLANAKGQIESGTGWTDIFIYPGYDFKFIDGLVTNFHLPKSSLLMLASAFAGHEIIKQTYQLAVADQYRFFSFGDAMLLFSRKE